MPKNRRSHHVTPVPGEAWRFDVESWDDPDHDHRIDLMAIGWNGECSCWDFRKTCMYNINEQLRISGQVRPVWYGTPNDKNPRRTRCRHLQIGFYFVCDKILPRQFPAHERH